jgi:hypothetical protein
MTHGLRGVATVAAAGAVIAAGIATATPAVADSHGCGDDVCVNFTGGASTDVGVTAWAYGETFNGYFTLTGPASYSARSSTETWNGGQDSDNWTFTVPSAPAGTYCVTATGSDGASYGTACEHVE